MCDNEHLCNSEHRQAQRVDALTARNSMAGSRSFIFIFLACSRSSTRLACKMTMRLMSFRCSALNTVNSSILLMNSGLKCERTYKTVKTIQHCQSGI